MATLQEARQIVAGIPKNNFGLTDQIMKDVVDSLHQIATGELSADKDKTSAGRALFSLADKLRTQAGQNKAKTTDKDSPLRGIRLLDVG